MGIHEKVFLIEDDPVDARDAFEELKSAGHELIQYAGNFEDASSRIPDAMKLGMTVAIVDGNLDHHLEDCADGREISQLIRDQAPGTTIVAYSRSSEKTANFGDIYVNKKPALLAEMITAIPREKNN